MANPLTPTTLNQDRRSDEASPALPPAEFTRLWLQEVPKVVARHQEERLLVQRELGLLS
jgi:hypothetical protein